MTPEDILLQIKRPVGWVGKIPTHSGRGLHIFDPQPGEICFDDVAWGLAHTFRYGGQAEPVTVAEHCLVTSAIIETMWPNVYGGPVLGGLLHDVSEAYTHDIQGPIRRCVRVVLPDEQVISWDDFDRRLSGQILEALGLHPAILDFAEVHAADILACALEKRQFPILGAEDWGLPPIPKEIESLTLSAMPPEMAYVMFLKRAKELAPSLFKRC